MAYQLKSKVFDLFGKPSCVVCGAVIQQSGGRGRVRDYCSNRCKMKARIARGYVYIPSRKVARAKKSASSRTKKNVRRFNTKKALHKG